MRNRTIGILAHVDAGKTTLSERILYLCGAVRAPGRVDRGDTLLDSAPVERERGVTVFSDQAFFEYGGEGFTLIDTPGHVDFAAETERALSALDATVLLADASEGVRPHTAMLARLAQRHGIPIMLFLNKCDLPAANPSAALRQAQTRLNAALVLLPADPERVAELDEAFLEQYLEGNFTQNDVTDALRRAFASGAAIPALTGSAMTGEGVAELLEALGLLTPPAAGDAGALLDARVYKVRRDTKGRRVTFVKLLAGTIRPRDTFLFGNQPEKVHEIRVYRGNRYETAEIAQPGDAVGLLGLSAPKCGDRLCVDAGVLTCVKDEEFEIQPALAASVRTVDGTSDTTLVEKLRLLEDEDERLGVTCDALTKEIRVGVMGPIQLEILETVLQERFGVRAAFEPPKVLYKETIAAPVMGYGHYEPLRHYAEVNLRIEPAPRGSGLSFDSECHVDTLPANYQSLIRTHVLERVHRGVLTGAPLTDVRIVLTAGRAHDKHTEGGDFREATYRAIRQGLMCAQSVLLEPYYRFEIVVPSTCAGRVLSDIPALAGTFDPPETLGDDVRVCGRGPAATFADYGVALRAFTRGRGSASMFMDGYDVCHDAQDVIERAAYDPGADTEQPASSVFCSHGAGFAVAWNEVQALMHCLKR